MIPVACVVIYISILLWQSEERGSEGDKLSWSFGREIMWDMVWLPERQMVMARSIVKLEWICVNVGLKISQNVIRSIWRISIVKTVKLVQKNWMICNKYVFIFDCVILGVCQTFLLAKHSICQFYHRAS